MINWTKNERGSYDGVLGDDAVAFVMPSTSGKGFYWERLQRTGKDSFVVAHGRTKTLVEAQVQAETAK